MYTLICGSHKFKNSNSDYFLKIISSKLQEYDYYSLKNVKYDSILESIYKNDVIVFAFPLYVDSPTSITLFFLDYVIDNNINLKGKLVYVVINCGFREGKQNITAVNIMKRWCDKVGAVYASSIMIGAGEIVGKDKFNFISRNALKKINNFANIIKMKVINDDIITTIDLLNNRLYCFLANLSWNKKGKKNNLSFADLKTK